MNINPEFLSGFWAVVGTLGYILAVFLALRSAAWWRLRNTRDFNVLFTAILGVLFIWTMQAGFVSALTLHLLGATLLTLMFGWAFAVLAISIVIISLTVIHNGSWIALPWNALLLGVLPITISYGLFRFTDRYLPNNFFIYIFICAFFGAALSMAGVIIATTGMHYLSGTFSMEYMSYNYFQYGLLIMFPEAFVTGMLMSIFIAYRPHWVSTFDDQRYLQSH